jgi:hypothetical protein
MAEIKEFEQRTSEVIADGDRRRLSLKESRQFLRQSQAQLGVLRIRSMSREARSYLDAADQAYTALLLHKSPIRTSNTVGLRAALSNLRGLGLTYGVWDSNPGPPRPTTTDESHDPFEAADKERERKRREEEKRRDRERDKDKDRDDKKDDDKKKDKDD